MSNIRRFCEEHVNANGHDIALTTSATAACEAGILALAPEADVVLYTDLAHPNVVHAIESASRIISGLRGEAFTSAMVCLRDLVTPGIDAATLAVRISDALLAATKDQRAIVVLEHVAYEEGLRIPIDAICEVFEGGPNQLLIDAAQAIGVWQPRNQLKANVFGCFHKFIGAPAGTGFLALRDRSERLPYSIGYTIHPEQPLDFPTTDIRKWEQTSLAINRLTERFGDAAKTEEEVRHFMERLRRHLSPLTSTLDDVTDPELRSHILTVQLASTEQAHRVVEELASHNVRVQEFRNRVRVSMGAQSRLADAQRIGSLLSHAVQSARLHTR
ncbi:MAG: aminotransferase class V-fold PLP-dependent enzyme [Pseudomonadota bacterium]|nr:aminotransferase class V-fold PLP-dependent enzyme [Pseudomonadota bacterium]